MDVVRLFLQKNMKQYSNFPWNAHFFCATFLRWNPYQTCFCSILFWKSTLIGISYWKRNNKKKVSISGETLKHKYIYRSLFIHTCVLFTNHIYLCMHMFYHYIRSYCIHKAYQSIKEIHRFWYPINTNTYSYLFVIKRDCLMMNCW